MRKTLPLSSAQTGSARRSHGVTLLEMMIAMAIVLTLSALAVPTLNAVRMAKLRSAGSDYASLLQNARITAIQNDAYYGVVTVKGTPTQSFIDLNGNLRLDQGEPVMAWPSSVSYMGYGDNPPGLANLETQSLASANDPSLDTADNPTFGPRGLPCRPVTGVGGFTTCLAFSGVVAGTSFITFFQSQPDGTWLAVVANPSARVRVFKYSGNSWSPVQ